MIAVILNHSEGLIYPANSSIIMHSIYSVSLFIFVAGITSAISISSKSKIDARYILKRLNSIIIPYFFATLVYHIINNNYRFDLTLFRQQIFEFSASGAFYFVAFFIQLVIISTVLYSLFKINGSILKQIFILLVIYFIASKYLNNFTSIGSIPLGGGKLLGGSYLFSFSLGMFFYMRRTLIAGKVAIGCLILSAISIFVIEYKSLLHLAWSNPPNKFALVYAFTIFGIIYSCYAVYSDYFSKYKMNYLKKLLNIVNYIGKNSLYIFLYHLLFLSLGQKYNLITLIFKHRLDSLTLINSLWYIFCAIVPPILMSRFSEFLKPKLLKLTFWNDASVVEKQNK